MRRLPRHGGRLRDQGPGGADRLDPRRPIPQTTQNTGPQRGRDQEVNKPMSKGIIAAAAVVAVVGGVWIAVAASDNQATDTAAAASPRPTVTVTAPAKPAPTVTTTTTLTITSVPQDCLDALDDADTVIATSAKGIGIMADAFTAASNLDVDGIQAATDKLNALNPT